MYILINKLDEIVNKCNSTYHSTIEMKPANVKNNAYIDFGKKKVIIKILNLKLIKQEYQNTKTFLLKDILTCY